MSTRSYSLEDLLYLMQRLRDPDTGCPWDIKQGYLSITPSTVEEAYEVVDAIEREDYQHLKEELGDLLFQVIFYGQLANEEDRFSFADVVDELTTKLIRRHPHVFPQGTLESKREAGQVADDTSINASWEAIKQQERKNKGSGGIFDDVPRSLPALTRGVKLQKRAAKVGFDWACSEQVLDKIKEEVDELQEAMAKQDSAEIANELGDVMFSCVNLARHLGQDPEALMRVANSKFERRFNQVYKQMGAQGKSQYSAEELEGFWQLAKDSE